MAGTFLLCEMNSSSLQTSSEDHYFCLFMNSVFALFSVSFNSPCGCKFGAVLMSCHWRPKTQQAFQLVEIKALGLWQDYITHWNKLSVDSFFFFFFGNKCIIDWAYFLTKEFYNQMEQWQKSLSFLDTN